MAARLDDGRIVFCPIARGAPMVDERVLRPSPRPVRQVNPVLELQRMLPPKEPRFDPARCQATVLRVRSLRALGLPHTVIEELTGVAQRTSSDICVGARGGRAEPTDSDLLEAGASLARWVIEKRGSAK